jgi:hypothetical protein
VVERYIDISKIGIRDLDEVVVTAINGTLLAVYLSRIVPDKMGTSKDCKILYSSSHRVWIRKNFINSSNNGFSLPIINWVNYRERERALGYDALHSMDRLRAMDCFFIFRF